MADEIQLPAHVGAALNRFRDALERHLGDRLVEVRLFGSYARGEAWAESDVDVLVIVEGSTRVDRAEIVALASDNGLSDDSCVVISPLVRSPEQVKELRRLERRLIQDIDREGVRL